MIKLKFAMVLGLVGTLAMFNPMNDAFAKPGSGNARAAAARSGGGGANRATPARPSANSSAAARNTPSRQTVGDKKTGQNDHRGDRRDRDIKTGDRNIDASRRNVNVNNDRNVNVNVNNDGYDRYGRPLVTAAATAIVIGTVVNTLPPSCSQTIINGVVYQQCGNTWYQPQGASYIVVNSPY